MSSNPNIVLYINNQISTCDACARIGLCGFNDCQIQEHAINESVINTLNKVGMIHLVSNPVIEVLKDISTDIVNYDNLNKIYLYSDKLSQLYAKVYRKVIGIDYQKASKKMSYKKFNSVINGYREQVDQLKIVSSIYM
jgi:hypothetical protein